MATANIRRDPNVTVLFRNENNFPSSPPTTLGPFWIPSSSSAPSLGSSTSMAKLENISTRDAGEVRFFHQIDREDEMEEDVYEGYMVNPQAKKRRLTASQVRVLEKNFEVENKLDPEKKMELAKELGLQPRQVAIWFQNRRARFKNKQLEKDSDSLRASYQKLKIDYDTLLKQNKCLRNQVSSLRDKLLNQENINENPKTQKFRRTESKLQFMDENLRTGGIAEANKLQEEASSSRSDVFDSGSPLNGSSQGFEHTEEEEVEDDLARSFLDTDCLQKVEDDGYYCDLHVNSSNLGFQLEDQPVWSWLY